MKNCFYCGKSLNKDRIDVDHFVPWSFVKDDNLWNLVLACPKCNRSKSDKLPAFEYVQELIVRNQKLMLHFDKVDFDNYRDETLCAVYDFARQNGFDVEWKPKK